MRTFRAVTLPLMLPGLANAWLVVFVESLADFGNPIVLGGSYRRAVHRDLLRRRRRAAGFRPRRGAGGDHAGGRRSCAFMLQRAVVGKRSYVSMTGKGDVGLPHAAADAGEAPSPSRSRIPWAMLTIVVYTMALAGAFVRVWGRDWTPTLSHFQRAFALEWAADGRLHLLGRRLAFAVHHHPAGRHRRADHRRARPARRLGADAPALRRAHRAGIRADADLRRAGHGDRRRLYPDLQRPAAGDHRAPPSSWSPASCSATCRSACAPASRR